MGQVLAQQPYQVDTAHQCGLVGGVRHGSAAGILVHYLLQPHQPLPGRDVVWVDLFCRGHSLVPVEGLHGSQNGLLDTLHVGVIQRRDCLVIGHVVDRGFRGQTPLGKGTGRELVGGCADAVAGSEQPADGSHLVVAPEVVRRRQVFGTAYPSPGLPGV